MWRRPPPLLVLFGSFAILGPPVGSLVFLLQLPAEAFGGGDRPTDVVSVILLSAYVVGLAPALLTACAVAYFWRRRGGPFVYLIACPLAGALCAALATLAVTAPLGGLDMPLETLRLIAF